MRIILGIIIFIVVVLQAGHVNAGARAEVNSAVNCCLLD